jgi:hypothetical protein
VKPPAILILCVLTTACGSPRVAPPPVPGPLAAVTQPAAAPSGPAPAPAPVVAPAPRVFDESLLRGKEFLLETAPRASFAAQDRVLGLLGAPDDVSAVVQKWWKAVRSGPWDDALVEPRWRAYLKAWAQNNAKDLGDGPVLVGKPLDQQGTTLVPVRISTATLDWTGWVVLVPAQGGWLVSDVQMLSHPADAGPFNPEGARQLISSPIRR